MTIDVAFRKAMSLVECEEISSLTIANIAIYRSVFIRIEYGTFGEGSQIATNQKRESTVFSLLIGRNLRPFPDNTALYKDILLKLRTVENIKVIRKTPLLRLTVLTSCNRFHQNSQFESVISNQYANLFISHLPFYFNYTPHNIRWGSLLQTVAMDHPLLPYAWRQFFKLYFHRITPEMAGVGFRYYQVLIMNLNEVSAKLTSLTHFGFEPISLSVGISG